MVRKKEALSTETTSDDKYSNIRRGPPFLTKSISEKSTLLVGSIRYLYHCFSKSMNQIEYKEN